MASAILPAGSGSSFISVVVSWISSNINELFWAIGGLMAIGIVIALINDSLKNPYGDFDDEDKRGF